jgi:hypothetical protein
MTLAACGARCEKEEREPFRHRERADDEMRVHHGNSEHRMAEMGQTHALQQPAPLFDHFAGGDRQGLRYGENRRHAVSEVNGDVLFMTPITATNCL